MTHYLSCGKCVTSALILQTTENPIPLCPSCLNPTTYGMIASGEQRETRIKELEEALQLCFLPLNEMVSFKDTEPSIPDVEAAHNAICHVLGYDKGYDE